MSLAIALAGRRPLPDVRLLIGLTAAAAIAWLQPFDLAFGAATFGVPALRAIAIAALALVGIELGGRVGLGLEPPGRKGPILLPLGLAAGTAVYCAGVDWLFRPALHADYRLMFSAVPLTARWTAFMLRAFNENIMYRLFLGATLAGALGRVWRNEQGGPANGAFWCAFALSQAINVWVNVTSQASLSLAAVAHDGLRYFAPGMLWSWLFWRRGFQANEIASTSVHLFFQPLAGALL